ncbi:S-adenosyl-L-methionine-dependent methyltransferase [Xylariaceae sp. FL1651]|nr:S-adenosyl-L-methionine-dependent methyltransferase [Xylariaceae sp. FL1651]
MARKGLHVTGIDVVERHVAKAKKTARKEARRNQKSKGSLEVRHMDYHHLESFADASFDGVYTMETLVHAVQPEQVLAGFFRVLRPGGRLAMHEYDNVMQEVEQEEQKQHGQALVSETSNPENEQSMSAGGMGDGKKKRRKPDDTLKHSMRQVNEWSAMPTNAISSPGAFTRMLEEAGFVDVQVRDLSDNIRPMTRFFFALAIVPFWIISLFGLERHFINTVAGVGAYRGYGFWRYVQIEARKPEVAASMGT